MYSQSKSLKLPKITAMFWRVGILTRQENITKIKSKIGVLKSRPNVCIKKPAECLIEEVKNE